MKPGKKLTVGDVITLIDQESPINPPGSIPNDTQNPPNGSEEWNPIPAIPILYEDSSCLVVNKPAGITVHPAASTKNETTLIEVLQAQIGSPLKLVHRIDKDTTGCLLVAKNAQALHSLQTQFRNRTVRKTYLAVVAGIPKEKKAIIEGEIGRSLVNRVKMTLFRTGKSRKAVTTYEVLSHSDTASLLRCDIHTGRTHQIRVHLRSIGHPILGDEKYGTDRSKELSRLLNVQSVLLHAWKIQFVSEGKEASVEAEIPHALKAVGIPFDAV